MRRNAAPTPVTIADLTLDDRNARKRGPRAEGMLVASLQEVGAARSIVIDEAGRILAGNGTVQAAAEAGIERVQVVDADGETIIAVRRTGLTEAQKRRLALLDNRTAELADWDAEVLAALAEEGTKLDDMFAKDELEEILAACREPRAIQTDPDATPGDEDVEPRCVRGDLWQCGDHRLLCGDSTLAEDVRRVLGDARPNLMVTDPPYGVNYEPRWRADALVGARAVGVVNNDDRCDLTDAWRLFPGNVAYVWHAARHVVEVTASLETAGFRNRAQIIWVKNNLVIGRGHYHWQHEPCWYCVRENATADWCGDRSQSTVWMIDKPQRSETGHSTQKPVECMARPMRNHRAPDVYDPFIGSGTTMIAAELLGRRCFGIEIDPQYCDVVLTRWEQATGGTARLIERLSV